MASNQETRIQQAILDYQTRRYPTIRSTAAANEVNHMTLGRQLCARTQVVSASGIKERGAHLPTGFLTLALLIPI